VNFLARLLNPTDPTASMRNAAFALVVLFACGWLSYALAKHGITSEWVAALGLLLTAVSTAKILGKTDESQPLPPSPGGRKDVEP